MVWNKRKIKFSDADTPPLAKKLKIDNENHVSPSRSEDSKPVVDKTRRGVLRSSSSSSFEPSANSPELRMCGSKIKAISKSGADDTLFVTALEVQN